MRQEERVLAVLGDVRAPFLVRVAEVAGIRRRLHLRRQEDVEDDAVVDQLGVVREDTVRERADAIVGVVEVLGTAPHPFSTMLGPVSHEVTSYCASCEKYELWQMAAVMASMRATVAVASLARMSLFHCASLVSQ